MVRFGERKRKRKRERKKNERRKEHPVAAELKKKKCVLRVDSFPLLPTLVHVSDAKKSRFKRSGL